MYVPQVGGDSFPPNPSFHAQKKLDNIVYIVVVYNISKEQWPHGTP
jgi:hypothetical protein